jgi:2-polyprenyl-6-methoxyphenol hydroxylase-like FAD-dependent oxidoreductase
VIPMTETDVLVVGAGPTGLMLACELALAGVRVRVLERRVEEPNITRAFGVHARTLELLDARGLADDLLARGASVEGVAPVPGRALELPALVHTRFPMILIVAQSGTEKLLAERAKQLGVEVVTGAKLMGLRQSESNGEPGVELDVEQAGGTRTERARFAVGCDGAHSTVRQLLGVDFVGAQYQTHIMLADVRFGAEVPNGLFGRNNADGAVANIPYGDGSHRVVVWDRRRETVPLDQPVTGAEIRDALRRIGGNDYEMGEPSWTSRFLSERRQARTYRVGHVFLAGDAAHVHSPLGAQGMNTGIQDAFNLGWKLAAVLHGWGPAWLLDSYQRERHPVGRSVLALTDLFNRLVLGRSRLGRELRNLAIRTVLRFEPFRREMANRLTGLGIRYPSDGEHKWVGRPMPDVALADGRLYERLRDGRFGLVDGTGELAETVRPWSDRVTWMAAPRVDGVPPVLLVRPDGYVGWASEAGPGLPDRAGRALARWCGPAQ